MPLNFLCVWGKEYREPATRTLASVVALMGHTFDFSHCGVQAHVTVCMRRSEDNFVRVGPCQFYMGSKD